MKPDLINDERNTPSAGVASWELRDSALKYLSSLIAASAQHVRGGSRPDDSQLHI
jgi:hypothetical protein